MDRDWRPTVIICVSMVCLTAVTCSSLVNFSRIADVRGAFERRAAYRDFERLLPPAQGISLPHFVEMIAGIVLLVSLYLAVKSVRKNSHSMLSCAWIPIGLAVLCVVGAHLATGRWFFDFRPRPIAVYKNISTNMAGKDYLDGLEELDPVTLRPIKR